MQDVAKEERGSGKGYAGHTTWWRRDGEAGGTSVSPVLGSVAVGWRDGYYGITRMSVEGYPLGEAEGHVDSVLELENLSYVYMVYASGSERIHHLMYLGLVIFPLFFLASSLN